MQIPVVENPRRRRRRHGLTAAQLRAGFGGKSSMSGARRRRRHSRRRNPALATYSLAGLNPRRRRRRSVRVRRHYGRGRRYSNPAAGMLGGLFSMHNVTFAGGIAVGITVGKLAPSQIARVWPAIPTTGFGGTAVRLGGVVLASFLVRKFLKMPQLANGMIVGELGYEMYQLASEYVFPKIGLAGLGAYDSGLITGNQLRQIGMGEYRSAPAGVGAYSSVEPAMGI